MGNVTNFVMYWEIEFKDGSKILCKGCKEHKREFINLWNSTYCSECVMGMSEDEIKGETFVELIFDIPCKECGLEVMQGYVINGNVICKYCVDDLFEENWNDDINEEMFEEEE